MKMILRYTVGTESGREDVSICQERTIIVSYVEKKNLKIKCFQVRVSPICPTECLKGQILKFELCKNWRVGKDYKVHLHILMLIH